jgi:transposase
MRPLRSRFDGVQVPGVDEHAWRHTRRGDKFVTVIIDLTPVRDGTRPSRLLDMVEGRSKQVFKTWLEAQTPAFRDGIELVATDGFTGFQTAAAEEIPDAVAVMDPFQRCRPGRRCAGPMPPTRPARHLRAPRPGR